MIHCKDAAVKIAPYVDHELAGSEALELEAHLTECSDCRSRYDSLRSVADAARTAAPLYEVPHTSFKAAAQLVANHESTLRRRRWLQIGAVAAVILAAVIISRRFEDVRYASFAAEAHSLYARGAYGLDVKSSEPAVVADWLKARLPFQMTLPNYPMEASGRKPYKLVGARLVQFLDQDAAYLAYEMGGKPISLVVASSAKVHPAGGETYHSGGLTFHFSTQKGLRLITWEDRGLTYALASNLEVRGAESCVICHGSTGDRPKFENLRRSGL